MRSEKHDRYEATLVELAKSGCTESFAELVRKYQVPLIHFLRQRAVNYQDAEDLTQEVFWRVYDQLFRYRSDYTFKTWVFTIAHRLLINHRRRPSVACFQSENISQIKSDQPVPGWRLEMEEQRRNLWGVAAEILNDSQFAALWLFYVEQMSTGEIARVLKCTRIGVKTCLFRARQKIKRRMLLRASFPAKPLDPDAHAASLVRQLTMELDHV